MVGLTSSGSLYIIGLAHAYPKYSVKQDNFEDTLKKLYPDYLQSPGLKKLTQFNKKTGIDFRRVIFDGSKWGESDATPPPIDELSRSFRTAGVDLTVTACREAMAEALVAPGDITHVVAVTCTDQGNPGYDLFVCQNLKLDSGVDRILLHGVGCAGGLSALRTASNLAAAASQIGRPARVLVFACELCSLFLRAELQAAAEDDQALHIAPALFSDAAAAVVVCNDLALGYKQTPIFELQAWGTQVVPGTMEQMSYVIERNGMIANITKDVPKTAISAIMPMFDRLRETTPSLMRRKASTSPTPSTYDWALHPGGAAILRGAQQALDLTDDHIRASLDVYKSYGNSSSPTVLIVLDELRRMGKGRDNVVAASFGPGIMVEMFLMRRCRLPIDPPNAIAGRKRKGHHSWLSFQSRIMNVYRRFVDSDTRMGVKRSLPAIQTHG